MSQVSGRQRHPGASMDARQGPKGARQQPAVRLSAAGDALRPDTCTTPTITATCPGPNCGKEIRIVTSREGRRLPLDPNPHPAGTVVVETDAAGNIRGRILTGVDLPAQGEAWLDHRTTCPDSPTAQRLQRATAPRCRACRGGLDPWLVANGWHHHVLCAPPADFRAHVQASREERST